MTNLVTLWTNCLASWTNSVTPIVSFLTTSVASLLNLIRSLLRLPSRPWGGLQFILFMPTESVTVAVGRDRKMQTVLRSSQIAGFVTEPSEKKISTLTVKKWTDTCSKCWKTLKVQSLDSSVVLFVCLYRDRDIETNKFWRLISFYFILSVQCNYQRDSLYVTTLWR